MQNKEIRKIYTSDDPEKTSEDTESRLSRTQIPEDTEQRPQKIQKPENPVYKQR